MNKYLNIANFLTLLRLLSVPILYFLITINYFGLALLLFTCASITDFFDGYLARYYNEETFFGACLDPVADKCLTFFLYMALDLPSWFLFLILIKEVLVLLGVVVFVFYSNIITIKPTSLAKMLMSVQSLFIWIYIFLRYCGVFGPTFNFIQSAFLILISIITLLVFCEYINVVVRGYLDYDKI